MEQRALIRFLTLKKLSARDVTAELEGVYGRELLSFSVVKKWCKQFANGRITLKGDPRPRRSPGSDLCEALRALINETPFLSCKRMCQKLQIARQLACVFCTRISISDNAI
jgi:transposase